jgi:hypothetical protein
MQALKASEQLPFQREGRTEWWQSGSCLIRFQEKVLMPVEVVFYFLKSSFYDHRVKPKHWLFRKSLNQEHA